MKKKSGQLLTPPPRRICQNDLLLQYAILDDSVGLRAGHGLMFVDGKEIGKVPCLAICQVKNSESFMLYYCNSDWSPFGIAVHKSVLDAERRAERIYPGSMARWRKP
jgi:hypothetical protein